jgi:hypothetical protein
MPAHPASKTNRPASQSNSHVDLDGLVPLRQLIKKLPSTGRWGTPHIASAIRWATTGVRCRNGNRIRLQALKCPSGWMSRPAWIAEFFEALTADRVEATNPLADRPLPVAPAQRRREIARADQILDAAGI